MERLSFPFSTLFGNRFGCLRSFGCCFYFLQSGVSWSQICCDFLFKTWFLPCLQGSVRHLSLLQPSCRSECSELGRLLDSTRIELGLQPCFGIEWAIFLACRLSLLISRTLSRSSPLCTTDFGLDS